MGGGELAMSALLHSDTGGLKRLAALLDAITQKKGEICHR